jgi:UDP-glucose 4-epimerase
MVLPAKRRIAITGAGGLIGTNLALRLLDDGHEVVGVDVAPNRWSERVPIQVQDLRSLTPEFAKSWGAVDAVVHLAARAKVHESVEHPRNALDNYTITFNVLEWCRSTGTPVIFGSSREVFGEQATLPVAEDRIAVKGAASPYAAAKIGEEALIQAYGKCYKLPFLIFRFSNVYGRFDDYRRTERFLPGLLRRLRRDEPIVVFGEEKRYDFTYIDDAVDGVVRGIEFLLRDGPPAAHTFNLGTGTGTGLVEAAQIVGRVVGAEPWITLGEKRVGEITRYVADITAARDLLGYEPAYDLERGIAAYYAWWRQQPDAEA